MLFEHESYGESVASENWVSERSILGSPASLPLHLHANYSILSCVNVLNNDVLQWLKE